MIDAEPYCRRTSVTTSARTTTLSSHLSPPLLAALAPLSATAPHPAPITTHASAKRTRILHLGCISVTLRVASLPNEGFDGDATVSFEVDGLGTPPPALDIAPADSTTSGDGTSGGANGSEAIAIQSLTSDAAEEGEGEGGAAATFDVSFYHCIAGNFWNSVVDEATGASSCASDDSADTCCELCSDYVDDEV